jgi:hypothetical protein
VVVADGGELFGSLQQFPADRQDHKDVSSVGLAGMPGTLVEPT